MKRHRSTSSSLRIIIALICSATANVAAQETTGLPVTARGTFVLFDAPTGYISIRPTGINATNAVAGNVLNGSGISTGFIRDSSGVITTFSAPGAANIPNAGTFPLGINSDGVITGYYFDSNFAYHGFVRSNTGVITDFDAPGASGLAYYGTKPFAINSQGQIAGTYYTNTATLGSGFLRNADGTLLSISTGSFTEIVAINTSGTTAGCYLISVCNGLIRNPSGALTEFVVPGALGTYPTSLNDLGTVAGYYYLGGLQNYHAFVRKSNGTVTPFDVAGAGTGNYQGTFPTGVDKLGAVSGWYVDSSSIAHGFERTPSGNISTFNVAGAQDTYPEAMTSNGVITGFYDNPGSPLFAHGFILTP